MKILGALVFLLSFNLFAVDTFEEGQSLMNKLEIQLEQDIQKLEAGLQEDIEIQNAIRANLIEELDQCVFPDCVTEITADLDAIRVKKINLSKDKENKVIELNQEFVLKAQHLLVETYIAALSLHTLTLGGIKFYPSNYAEQGDGKCFALTVCYRKNFTFLFEGEIYKAKILFGLNQLLSATEKNVLDIKNKFTSKQTLLGNRQNADRNFINFFTNESGYLCSPPTSYSDTVSFKSFSNVGGCNIEVTKL